VDSAAAAAAPAAAAAAAAAAAIQSKEAMFTEANLQHNQVTDRWPATAR
jgi:hypothetical protein